MTNHQNCITCNKKLEKDDAYNCWSNHCQLDGQRCGDCAEIHEQQHIDCGDK